MNPNTVNLNIYLEDNNAIGCIFLEQMSISETFQLFRHGSSTDKNKYLEYEVNIEMNSKIKSSDYLLGIRYIWVHKSRRRSKVASLLLDTGRKTLLYGRAFDRNEVCFSQPTRLGLEFAFNYTLSEYILAYK